MRFEWVRTGAALAAVLAAAACADFSPALTQSATPNGAMGYLYGRFSLAGNASAGLCALRVGISVQQLDGDASYTAEFTAQDAPFALEVKPGRYRLRSIVFATCDGRRTGEKPMPEGVLTTAFDVDPGKAYYIADMVEREGFVAIRDYADPDRSCLGNWGP